MAHTPAPWLAVALLAAATAHAVELGPVEVGSALGEPLDARIPLRAAAGERFEAACFYLSHPDLGAGRRLTLALERSARGSALRLRSAAPFDLPAVTLGVRVACPGREAQPIREVALLVDPRSRVSSPVGAAMPPITASIRAPEGATLASIARTIHPREGEARAAYVDALVSANPQLGARGAEQPIATGTAVALPDLRTFRATRRAAAGGTVPLVAERRTAAPPTRGAARAPVPPVEVEAPPPPAAALAAAAPRTPEPSEGRPPTPRTQAASLPKQGMAPARAEGGFVLRLSSAPMDLSRSRGIDERRRAELRERQLILDQDDQVAALLSMKHSLRQLEARVSELQLKLAGMPASFPERPAGGGSAAPASPAAAAPMIPDRPKPAGPPRVEALASTAPSPTVTPPPQPPDRPVAETGPTAPALPAAKPPSPAVPAIRPPAHGAATMPAQAWNVMSLLREHGAWLAGLAAVLLFALAYAMWRRHRQAREDLGEPVAGDQPWAETPQPPSAGEIGEIAAPVPAPAAVARPSISSDEHLPTRLRDPDAGDLRRRYIEERFPEVASRAIRLEDTDSVVKGARLFYEDGELPRAIELLQLAIEARPGEVRLWLALFEIFRLERLPGEFAQLAQRFQEQHAGDAYWPKVRFFGREVDPGNPLYREEPVDTLETIGPREARRLAAQAGFDPIAENWLNAPMDFENEVLANDLRRALMAEAAIAEQDLLPAPRSALRNVEMFTVA